MTNSNVQSRANSQNNTQFSETKMEQPIMPLKRNVEASVIPDNVKDAINDNNATYGNGATNRRLESNPNNDANCDEYHFGCPLGKYVDETQSCGATQCANTMSDTCCTKSAESCINFEGTCTGDRVRRDAGYCSQEVCDDNIDEKFCCVDAPLCIDTNITLECPAGKFVKADEVATCAQYPCEQTDATNCCNGVAESCALWNSTCPSGKVKNDDNYCSGTTCQLSDHANCCVDKALCSTWEGNCKSGFFKDDEQHCAGATCNPDYNETCCVEKASCSNFTDACPSGKVKDASQKCTGATCVGYDAATCCVDNAKAAEDDTTKSDATTTDNQTTQNGASSFAIINFVAFVLLSLL